MRTVVSLGKLRTTVALPGRIVKRAVSTMESAGTMTSRRPGPLRRPIRTRARKVPSASVIPTAESVKNGAPTAAVSISTSNGSTGMRTDCTRTSVLATGFPPGPRTPMTSGVPSAASTVSAALLPPRKTMPAGAGPGTGAATRTVKEKCTTPGGTLKRHSRGAVVSPGASGPAYWKYFCAAAVIISSPSALLTPMSPAPSVACGAEWKNTRTPSGAADVPSTVPSACVSRFSSVTFVRKTAVAES